MDRRWRSMCCLSFWMKFRKMPEAVWSSPMVGDWDFWRRVGERVRRVKNWGRDRDGVESWFA